MSPRKQPLNLFDLGIINTVKLINTACYAIEKRYPQQFEIWEKEALSIKRILMGVIPARFFDVLCSNRNTSLYHGDPRLPLHVLTHPSITVFRKSEFDNSIPQPFWLETLPQFKCLVILDLKFICTDELLKVIAPNCPLLEEFNIVSKVDICKSLFNASVLLRNVSDSGLKHVALLKKLRILAMDPPRNERAVKLGKHVTQAGIIMLVSDLPCLEELRIESCDIGSTLINATKDLGPLGLTKINYHFASPPGIRKLIKTCPFLRELSVTHLTAHSKDAILEQITNSDLKLNKLDLSFFSFVNIRQLLQVKGIYLTHFSLWEIEHSINLDGLLSIAKCCPNLQTLCVMTQSHDFFIPNNYQPPKDIFLALQKLTLGNGIFDLDRILSFFFECTQKIHQLIVKFQTKKNVDDTFLRLIDKGCLRNLNYLWLDCTLEISKNVIKRVIQSCDKLQMFTVDFPEDMSDVQTYINENNLDLKLGSY